VLTVDRHTPEDAIADLVDAVVREPQRRDLLVGLLPEEADLYAGRGANTAHRLRGYVLAAFEHVGLPEAALPFVVQELESGRNAYVVAAAAKALRGCPYHPPDAARLLLAAIDNIRYADDAVSFDGYRPRWPRTTYTTALEEIARTFAWLGDHAAPALPALEELYRDTHSLTAEARAVVATVLAGGRKHACCTGPSAPAPVEPRSSGRAVPREVELQDQDGRTLTFGQLVAGRPTVVTFFYTRCDNPNKCALTITKLARLHEARRAHGLDGRFRTAAITYDPAFDIPARLLAYGLDHGLTPGPDDRLLRTTGDLDPLARYFRLGVNYGPTTVNQHRIELFVLDEAGRIGTTFDRRQWDVAAVLDAVRALLP
jgi:protein SCO1/2